MGYSPLVSAAYDFTRSGAGEYYIEPSDVFIYVDADGTPQQFHAIVRDAVKVRLSGNLSVSREHREWARSVGRSSTRQSQTNTGSSGAQPSAGKANSYPQNTPGGTRRYSTWFGARTTSRRSIAQEHSWLIGSCGFSSFTCGYTHECVRVCTFQPRDRCSVINTPC